MTINDDLILTIEKYDLDLYRGDQDIPTYLDSHFKKYVKDIESTAASGNNSSIMNISDHFCKDVSEKVPFLKEVCDHVVDIARYYYEGKTKDAYESAHNTFSQLDEYYIQNDILISSSYRIRSGDFRIFHEENEALEEKKKTEERKKKKAELFHIKNHQRNIIPTYRYSASGFPCLYLTYDSGYELAWFECGMPKQFSYCIMRSETTDDKLKLIDFNKRPGPIVREIFSPQKIEERRKNELLDDLLKYIITYPLVASCSLKVMNRSDKFVEEYIIPQMFTQWIKETEKFDGVMYPSCQYNSSVRDMTAFNIVLPASEFRDDGLCKKLTSKISVSDIAYLDVKEYFKKYKEKLQAVKDFKNKIWGRRIGANYYPGYLLQLIEICDTIDVTYNALLNDHDLNLDVVFHQIDSLYNFINLIYRYKCKFACETVKDIGNDVIEGKYTEEDVIRDINEFKSLVSEVVHRNEVFSFPNDIPEKGFEKI